MARTQVKVPKSRFDYEFFGGFYGMNIPFSCTFYRFSIFFPWFLCKSAEFEGEKQTCGEKGFCTQVKLDFVNLSVAFSDEFRVST